LSTTIAAAPHAQAGARRLTPARARLILAAAMATAAAAGFALTAPATGADPALTRLLRAMAVIKILFAAGAGATLYWRLASPVAPWRLAAYATAAAAMAAGPGLIWNMSHIAAGAALLHGGLLATILLLWRDPGMALRLEQEMAIRRSKKALF